MTITIPCVDLKSTTSSVSDSGIAQQLDKALSSQGFCYIQGHGISEAEISQIFEANIAFHRLAHQDKEGIAVNAFHRGYIGKDASKTVTSTVEAATHANRSESFMVMQSVSPNHGQWGSAIFGLNQCPKSLGSHFRTQCFSYFKAMPNLAEELTQRLAVAFGLGPDAFSHWFTEPTVFLRLLKYPAAATTDPPGEFGSAPHTDHGFLTLVAQDTTSGLQVKGTDGTWIPLPPVRSALVLNVADMLSVISGGRWPSSPHRVVLNRNERYSTAFFDDPNFSAMIEPQVPPTAYNGNDAHILYGECLMARLDKNYRYRSEME